MKRLQVLLCDALKRSVATGRGVRVPEAGLIFWEAFRELSADRRYSEGVPLNITAAEIAAYAARARVPFGPAHVELIRAMDAAWLEVVRLGDKAPVGDLDGATFDAIFG